MPNWCFNYLNMNEEDMKKYVLNEDGKVDFNIICPMPEPLNVASGSSNDTDICVYVSNKLTIPVEEAKEDPYVRECFPEGWFEREYERASKFNEKVLGAAYERGKVLIDNYNKYGAITWYNWCCDNWGVKWNAKSTYLDSDINVVYFETPWGPPTEWLKALADLGVDFTLDWDEEGGERGEIYTYEGQVHFN